MDYSIIEGSIRQSTNNPILNVWEQLETHMHDNLGIYGLQMMDRFLDLKEQAEDCKMCPPDTPERQEQFEQQHGLAYAPVAR